MKLTSDGKIWIQDDDKFFYNRGDYEIKLRTKAVRYFKEARVAVDVGAHVGIWTTFLAKYFERVYAFEPNVGNYECLQKNCEKFKNIETFNFGLSEIEGLKRFKSGSHNNKGCGKIIEKGSDTTILVKPLDMIEIRGIDFIKIDIEAHEDIFLCGAKQTLLREKPNMCVEIFETEGSKFWKFLNDNEYKMEKYNDAGDISYLCELGG